MSELPPNPAAADRNLLFGILALQMDFIGRDDLVTAMNAWVLDKAKALGQILLAHGALVPERLALLEALVAEHLKVHQDDVQLSLAALASVAPVRQDLHDIADADLQASLAVAGPAGGIDPEATGPYIPQPENGTAFAGRFAGGWKSMRIRSAVEAAKRCGGDLVVSSLFLAGKIAA
jgi:hypothetical protein